MLRIYEHSLGLAFILLFLVAWIGHALGGFAGAAGGLFTSTVVARIEAGARGARRHWTLDIFTIAGFQRVRKSRE